MRDEIYDFDERLERYRRIIAKFGANGEVALHLLNHLASLGLSKAALSNNAAHLIAVLRLIDFDVKSAAREDVERALAKINMRGDWKENTKYHKRVVLRRLIQYAKVGRCDRGAPVPPEASWIKVTKTARDSRVTPEALIGEDEFRAMVQAADNPRDRAMLHVLFEAALRPGELLSMKVSSVEFKKDYCLITVSGKTGIKRIPLIASMQPLLDWLRIHPRRNDPEVPLWCSLSTNGTKGERLSYRHFRLIIKKIAKKAGLRKDVWPYLFRHTTLTKMAKILTEAQLEKFAGWVHGSKMAARYVHFSARDVEEAILALYGIESPERNGTPIKIVKCPRCGSHNPETHRFCSQCGLPLSMATAYKAELSAKEVVEAAEAMEDMKKEIAELKAQILEILSAKRKRSRRR